MGYALMLLTHFFPSTVCGLMCDSSAESTLFTLLMHHCSQSTANYNSVKVAEVGCVLLLEYLFKLELE